MKREHFICKIFLCIPESTRVVLISHILVVISLSLGYVFRYIHLPGYAFRQAVG